MASSQPDPTYTVFVRLPFPRGDFVDPPLVNWDSSKDEALWGIVSRLSKTEIDWNEIASKFQVTIDFLIQQAAWLTERHASQVRAQMRKAAAAAKGSSAPSPQERPDGPFLAEPMRRTGSGGGQARAPSSLSIRKDPPLPRNDASTPGTPLRNTPRPGASRTSSTNTEVFTARNLGGSSRAPVRTSADAQRRRLSSLPIATSVDDQESDPPSPEPAESSSASSSSASSPAQSRIIRRPPRFQGNDATSSFADDDDDDAHPAFLPYRLQADGSTSGQHDLSATLRGDPRGFGKRVPKVPGRERIHQSQTSDSSTSSAAPVSKGPSDKSRPSGPLSPRRTMELAGRSPAGKGKGYSRDSDGTPSMGSSFSDLDDASVTQSALEEALASKMQDGGTIGSLRGTISNAFRSRYQPK
ncbi:Uu.00g111010.m01.CDS01 [Anthostomella pinea]|uniref:Autophagy-related protein 29 n=1 Tax=Anthostomella pinea TaxID=933095 RepID=A0AAI8VF12_9PEZI|nr:Uu.00g111010.m01.CDS01 [Anthostomella pinea]